MASAQITNSTTGFLPTHQACIDLKNDMCTSTDCQSIDVAAAAALLDFAGAPELNPAMSATTAALWAQFGFVLTSALTGGQMDQIHPDLYAVYECEARNSGIIWANAAAPWLATQTCRADPACVTAWTNIRTNSIAGAIDLGTVQDDGAKWMEIAAIGWYVPDPTNTDKQFCNMAFATQEEKNAKAGYLLGAMTALWFTPEQQASILDTCEQDVEDFVVGLVTTHVVKAMLIFSFVGLAVGSLFTGLGCYCCNRKSKSVNGV